jgi:hypothetical protein
MTCSKPLDAAVLADYWLGVLTEPEEVALEEHLFACGECAERLKEVGALADGISNVARHGNLLRVVSDEFLRRAANEGMKIREYAPPRGGSVQCTVTAEDDLLIGRLNADLTAAKRLDISLCNVDGSERMRLPDIPFRPNAGSIVFQQPIEYAKAAPSDVMIARLVSVDAAGSNEVLGEYTFIHTRTIPGPPGW